MRSTPSFGRIERFIARAWFAVTSIATALAIVIALTVDQPLGIGMALVGVVATLACGFSLWRLHHLPLGERTSVFTAIVEGMLPWVSFGVLAHTQGAAYALASWVPPMIYSAVLIAWIARLRADAAIVMAATGTVTYLVVYFVLVRPHVPTGAAHSILQDPPMQFSRAFTMLFGGGLGARLAGPTWRCGGKSSSASTAS